MKTFENAWIVISSEKFKYPTWRKFSSLKFMMAVPKNDTKLVIGYLDMIGGQSMVGLDRVHDLSTFKVEIDDVASLKASTPFELFVQLDLRGLVAYDNDANAQDQHDKAHNKSFDINDINSFDNSAFNISSVSSFLQPSDDSSLPSSF